MNEAGRRTRAHYHLCLGPFKSFLKEYPDYTVHFDFDEVLSPCDPHSYRGYYSDMSFQRINKPVRAGDLLEKLESIKEVTGYKGGTFPMVDDTPLWCSTYGECDQIAVMGVQVNSGVRKLVIQTQQIAGF